MSNDISEQAAKDAGNLLIDRILGSFRKWGPGKMQTHLAVYEPNKDGIRLVGIQMSPTREQQRFDLDTDKLRDLFDKMDFIGVGTHMKDRPAVPHVRMMGRFRGMVVMCDIFLVKTELPV